MRSIIEFCVNNFHHGTDQLFEKLEADPEYDVIEYGCLGNCGQCFKQPYAMVNGEIIAADTADELYKLILEAIEAYEKQWLELDF